ncbi:MAG TPA: Rnase Y domain-containing protein, partial [Actinomycetota bacterium]|nr:Rnase Y domain-containing protein [Actinomycetota bacterium]
MVPAIVGILALLVGIGVGILVRTAVGRTRADSAEARAQRTVLEAEREAERITREALVEARDEIGALRREAEEELRTRREETKRQEARLGQREETLESKLEEVQRRADELDDRDRTLQQVREHLEHAAEQHRERLEQIARMTSTEAKEALVSQILDQAKRDAMVTVRDIEQRAREEGEERARKIVTIAIQRVASEQTSESSVSVFSLPSDDMKGRIIGREGRNIRAFEATTGVNLIIDDTPEAVVLSSFDPVRRETARMTLEKLVQDGRIHPARIEEMHERSQREIEEQIKRAGEEAALDVGLADLHPEM